MKKTFNRLIKYICLIMLVFCFSGCSQFVDLGANKNYEQTDIIVALDKQMIFCDTGNSLGQPNDLQVSFNDESLSSGQVAEKVKRSVVSISISSGNAVSSGSGVIVDIIGGLEDNEYYIMTCHHVISSGGVITVYLPDREGKNTGDFGYDKSYVFTGNIGKGKSADNNSAVSLVGGDRDGDIAILKLKVGNKVDKSYEKILVTKATFPNKNTLSISYGEEVFAIGNPTGELPMTYLHGHISYLDRKVVLESVGIMTNLIQHDCAITHGSSGGGLFNMKGQLIGITNAGLTEHVGLSYAIPYYTHNDSKEYGFMDIAKQLIENSTQTNYGYVEGRWKLGIVITEADRKVSGSNVTIKSVDANSLSYGKIKKGDYITKIEFLGREFAVTDQDSFIEAIFEAREKLTVGQESEIKFTVQRAK